MRVHAPKEYKMKCRKWVLRSHFSGIPKKEDLEIVEEELPPLKDGGMAASIMTSAAYDQRKGVHGGGL